MYNEEKAEVAHIALRSTVLNLEIAYSLDLNRESMNAIFSRIVRYKVSIAKVSFPLASVF